MYRVHPGPRSLARCLHAESTLWKTAGCTKTDGGVESASQGQSSSRKKSESELVQGVRKERSYSSRWSGDLAGEARIEQEH